MTIHTLCAAIIDAHEKAQECPGTEAAKVFTRDMQDAIHQLVSQYGWRDMEDAPKDGSKVLVRRGRVVLGECHFDDEWINCGFPIYDITAWMPLPTANPGGSAPRGEG